MTTARTRTIGASVATAVAGSMLVAAPAATAAPGDNRAGGYAPERLAQVVLKVPRPAKNAINRVIIRLTSDAGEPNGFVVIKVRRQNGKVIAKRTCRTAGNSRCVVKYKAPKRGKAGFVTARYVGNSKYEEDTATKRFRFQRSNAR